MTGTDSLASPLAVFRGSVTCRRDSDTLTLAGSAADSADGRLILTFIAPSPSDLPVSVPDATVVVVDEQRYRVISASRDWIVGAASVHLHRDVGDAFYRAIPPRPVPLKKRLFLRLVLALAGSRTGKRVLASLRRR